ncbi:MAG: RNA pyrophosphohydrolase [Alphaproteobacteria bacterium]|nr:RNA pyrophosphohydrolase [Alphaproteobacteria bacterium]
MTTGIDFQKLPYRRGVGLCLFNAQGLVLVAERRDQRGAWQMPQGGVQKEEAPMTAVLREMKEEIGTDNARIIAKVPEILRYEFPDWLQKRRISSDGAGGIVFRGKYRGQEQEWYALRFLGQDSEIDLSGKNEPEMPEFVAWKWIELAQAPDLIVSFKKPAYDRLVEVFTPIGEAIRRGEEWPEWKG